MDPEKETCNLLIRDFPVELAERCLSASGEKVLTRSVLKLLYSYFELERRYRQLSIHYRDFESDVDLFKQYLRAVDSLDELRKSVLKTLSDPNRFYLHGD